MTFVFAPERILQYARHALPDYAQGLRQAQGVLERHGIDTPLLAAHFMAQVMHESEALQATQENLSYSALQMTRTWPRRFKPNTCADPQDYEYQPAKLADYVYGGRPGNQEPGDGYKFRGRGLLQLTGRPGYTQVSKALQGHYKDAPDLLDNPDAVFSAQWAFEIATLIWVEKGCNKFAAADDCRKVTRAINGGVNGLAEREKWLHWMKLALRQ